MVHTSYIYACPYDLVTRSIMYVSIVYKDVTIQSGVLTLLLCLLYTVWPMCRYYFAQLELSIVLYFQGPNVIGLVTYICQFSVIAMYGTSQPKKHSDWWGLSFLLVYCLSIYFYQKRVLILWNKISSMILVIFLFLHITLWQRTFTHRWCWWQWRRRQRRWRLRDHVYDDDDDDVNDNDDFGNDDDEDGDDDDDDNDDVDGDEPFNKVW